MSRTRGSGRDDAQLRLSALFPKRYIGTKTTTLVNYSLLRLKQTFYSFCPASNSTAPFAETLDQKKQHLSQAVYKGRYLDQDQLRLLQRVLMTTAIYRGNDKGTSLAAIFKGVVGRFRVSAEGSCK